MHQKYTYKTLVVILYEYKDGTIMYKFINQLSSFEDINSLLQEKYQEGYELTQVNYQFLKFDKVASPKNHYFNLSYSPSKTPVLDAKNYAHVYAYYSGKNDAFDLKALKEYYDALNVSYKRTTLYCLIALLIFTVLTGFVPILPPAIGGWVIGILMVITVIRSVNQRRFTRKLYVPFLRNNGFSNKELQNRFILKSHHTLNESQMNRFKKHGELSYLKEIEGYHFYQLISFEQRNDIINVLVDDEVNTIEVLSTVKE